MKPKTLFLILSVAGAVIPFIEFVPWVLENGLNLRLMIAELFETQISAFFALDVIVSALVVVAFALIERSRLRMRFWFLPIVGVACVGVSFGLPLLLYLREVEFERRESSVIPIRSPKPPG